MIGSASKKRNPFDEAGRPDERWPEMKPETRCHERRPAILERLDGGVCFVLNLRYAVILTCL